MRLRLSNGCRHTDAARRLKGVQIGTGEHCVQTILVFLQASVRHFSVAKLAFYYSEYVLHLTANGRFAVFDVPFQVDCVVTHSGQTPGAAADTKINVCKMRILFDFGTFLNTNIGRISLGTLSQPVCVGIPPLRPAPIRHPGRAGRGVQTFLDFVKDYPLFPED